VAGDPDRSDDRFYPTNVGSSAGLGDGKNDPGGDEKIAHILDETPFFEDKK
jgi:hypothetical protein